MLTYADVCWRQLVAGATGVVICSYPMEHLRVIPTDDFASIPQKKEKEKRRKNVLTDARALLFAALDTRASGTQFACFTGTKVQTLMRQRWRRLKRLQGLQGLKLPCADVCCRMLSYADVCRRMLTYADASSGCRGCRVYRL